MNKNPEKAKKEEVKKNEEKSIFQKVRLIVLLSEMSKM